mmetsp:Transcript_16656/g.18358  ORF Transcript_16656/g.18358 Transcript_16656/m.18358 type:complete len:416 (+) Transcript_16656:159-1406(+)
MILHLVILFLLLLVDESLSWTSRIRQHSPRKVTLRMSTNKDGDHGNTKDVSVEGLIGRRRWLGSLTTAATVTIALPSFASNDIPSAFTSKAVCDPTVSVWKKNGRIIYLLGTAHISSSSAALAGQLVRDTIPKGVFVELDPKRVSGSGILSQKLNNESGGSLTRESKVIVPKISAVEGDGGLVLVSSSSSSSLSSSEDNSSPTTKPAKQNKNDNPIMKVAAAAVGNSIKGLYKRLDSAGFESGEEFVTAVKEGRKISADIILGDRDVELTLRRVTEGLVKTDLKAFLSSDSELERTLEGMALPMNSEVGAKLSGSSDVGKDLTDEQFREELTSFVETMKTKDNVRTVMGQLKRVAPFLYEALVSERDTYMATGLNGLNELESIVAVVGIAHADGIENSLQMNGWEANNLSCGKYR